MPLINKNVLIEVNTKSQMVIARGYESEINNPAELGMLKSRMEIEVANAYNTTGFEFSDLKAFHPLGPNGGVLYIMSYQIMIKE